jgi:hypothetical protein
VNCSWDNPNGDGNSNSHGDSHGDSHGSSRIHNVLAFFARELQRFNDRPSQPGDLTPQEPEYSKANRVNGNERRKRRRPGLDDRGDEGDGEQEPVHRFRPTSPILPPSPILHTIIRAYFSHVHPWIPMIQEKRFRRRLTNAAERPRLLVILHAMVVASWRYTDNECRDSYLISLEDVEYARNWIVSSAISSFCVESLQALTIIAFDDVSSKLNHSPHPGSSPCSADGRTLLFLNCV